MKLGIDPSKDEVLILYKVLHENLEGDLPAVEPVTSLNCVSPCTPLLYMFDSELDQVANCALPSEADLLQGNPQCAVIDKLGEHAWFMLDTYLTVADITTSICVSNAPTSSELGQMVSMTNKLLLKILKHALLRDVLLKPLIR